MSSILSPATIVSGEIKQSLSSQTDVEGQVTIHVEYEVKQAGEAIRIWPTTYLVPQEGGNKSKLVTFEKISLAPFWTILRKKGTFSFTLVFSPLPKSCQLFHLWEDIEQPGGFLIRNIKRNHTDVYEVILAP
jgi:hypothetical protein